MTQQNAKDYLPLVKALSEGKVIQYRVTTDSPWANLDDPGFQAPPELYRICPEKRRAPLDASDVPPGSVMRSTKWESWSAIIGVGVNGIHRMAGSTNLFQTFKELAENDCWQIKRPTDSDWLPCWKELSE